MAEAKTRFPQGLEYVVALDTTLAVTSGIKDIQNTILEALALVTFVVFFFLQGWRATLIPLLAVPVSLVGTFILFPLLGFSINTLSLFGLVLAVGLVVDDAIVVVEAVEHHIERGLTPHDAALRAMEEVSGPVIAIALILAAVFIPTAFIPGITGRLYQQFAVTIAVSVALSAFNALTLSPALAGMLLRPKKESRGPLGAFFRWFNRVFGRATDGYVGACRHLIHKSWLAFLLLAVLVAGAWLFGKAVPGSFLPDEDQGFMFVGLQLPPASSLQRTSEASREVEDILMKTPGVKYVSSVVGYSLLSGVSTTYSSFFFVSFKRLGGAYRLPTKAMPRSRGTWPALSLTLRRASPSPSLRLRFPVWGPREDSVLCSKIDPGDDRVSSTKRANLYCCGEKTARAGGRDDHCPAERSAGRSDCR